MDLRLLAYFTAVAEELSFVRAATRLFVTTPTVSAGVRDLERSLGVRLFDRTPRSVTLTSAGRALLPQARRVLTEADGVRALAQGLTGRTSVVAGTFLGLGAPLLEAAARALHAVEVDVDLQLRVYGFDGPARRLCSGEVDVAVLVGPSALDAQLVRTPLHAERRLAVLPHAHPLAVRASLTLPELDALRWVGFPRRDEVWHGWWRLDDARGGPPPEAARVHDDPHELLLAVRNGEGTGTALEHLRDQFSYEGLVLRPVDGISSASVDLAVRRGAPNSALAPFLAAVRRAAALRIPRQVAMGAPRACECEDSPHEPRAGIVREPDEDAAGPASRSRRGR